MLVLSRKTNESVRATLTEEALEQMLDTVRRTGKPLFMDVMVISVKGQAKLGITAPTCVPVLRGELLEQDAARATPHDKLVDLADAIRQGQQRRRNP